MHHSQTLTFSFFFSIMTVLLMDVDQGCALLDAANFANKNVPPNCSDKTSDQFAIDVPFALESDHSMTRAGSSSRSKTLS